MSHPVDVVLSYPRVDIGDVFDELGEGVKSKSAILSAPEILAEMVGEAVVNYLTVSIVLALHPSLSQTPEKTPLTLDLLSICPGVRVDDMLLMVHRQEKRSRCCRGRRNLSTGQS